MMSAEKKAVSCLNNTHVSMIQINLNDGVYAFIYKFIPTGTI